MSLVALEPVLSQVVRAREVLAAAFTDDPLMQWLFPEPVGRADAVAAWLGVFVEGFAASAVVDTVVADDGQVAGVALWRLGATEVQFPPAPTVGGLLVALVGPEAAVQFGGGLGAFAANKPEPPFHYLQFLAVHPAYQGQGVGVYLESTNPRNLAFYHSLGLQSLGQFTLQPSGPVAHRLWWQP